jgi:hypothetical protein
MSEALRIASLEAVKVTALFCPWRLSFDDARTVPPKDLPTLSLGECVDGSPTSRTLSAPRIPIEGIPHRCPSPLMPLESSVTWKAVPLRTSRFLQKAMTQSAGAERWQK